jgi:hypothetical protein
MTAPPFGVALWWVTMYRQALARIGGVHSAGAPAIGPRAVGTRGEGAAGAGGNCGETGGAEATGGRALKSLGPLKFGEGRFLTIAAGCSGWQPASAKTAIAATHIAHALAILGPLC